MYDYIKARKPILSIGSNDDIHCRMIQQENLGYSSENNEEDIYNNLTKLYDLRKGLKLNSFGDEKNIYHYSREYKSNKYLNLIIKCSNQE